MGLPLGDRLMVGRMTLDRLVGVRIPVPLVRKRLPSTRGELFSLESSRVGASVTLRRRASVLAESLAQRGGFLAVNPQQIAGGVVRVGQTEPTPALHQPIAIARVA
jgi:hypothetical protein